MKSSLLALALGAVLISFASVAYTQRAVFLIRHTDRLEDSGDTFLSKAGEARAQLLARLLKDAGITAIYTSQFQRTIKTAEPLATSLQIKPASIPAADREGLFKRIRTENVWPSGDITIAATEYDNLFVLVPKDSGPPTVLRMRY
jgi:hypothetical protein